MPNEADTCRRYVTPKLQEAGWDTEPHLLQEQYAFTDGRIVVSAPNAWRGQRKRADYVLRFTRDFPMAVVEAKADYRLPSDGMQQAKAYAEILGLSFAYATNGAGIVEFDYCTGRERALDCFPSPDDLWYRLQQHHALGPETAARLLQPSNHAAGRLPRYYQELAVNRAVQAILQGRSRLLLTMATGTGKTAVAFQICWKLWNSRWNRRGTPQRPRLLYLADRRVLVDDPREKEFAPFGEARHKIANGEAIKSREVYFATYQALAHDDYRPGLYREYAPDFFDLIIVDECHRGSAGDESNWREILEYFAPAAQLGMTATPKRADNIDTYAYFGDPLYTYSLAEGIADGFLAPYLVHQVITAWDAAGWRPSKGELDRRLREIPDVDYQTKDFERVIALQARTEAIARHLTEHLKRTDRMAKTIVFCVDQEHAATMRQALIDLNADLVQQYPDYVCRVTADEGEFGQAHLSHFQDVDRPSPVILTTSQLLTTGVDVPTCKNVVLVRAIGSMTEFKQIIGRGTRVREDYGKLYFTILDYAGSATRQFADPDFDGEPVASTSVHIDDEGREIPGSEEVERPPGPEPPPFDGVTFPSGDVSDHLPRKYYVDGGAVEIAYQMVHELDPEGKQLRVMTFSEYATEKVRTLYRTSREVQQAWADPQQRAAVIAGLAARGIDLAALATATGRPDADPLDLLCHLAFNAPLRTRRERAERLRTARRDFFDQYGPTARVILVELLEKYAEYGPAQFAIPDALKVPPLSDHGNVLEIARHFGGSAQLRAAINELQRLLYAA
jgi:type I restriction enzyme R subunit